MQKEKKILLGTRFWDLKKRNSKYFLCPPMYYGKPWISTPHKSNFKPRKTNQTGLYANGFNTDYLVNFTDDDLPWRERAYGLVLGSGASFISKNTNGDTLGFRSHQQQIAALFIDKSQACRLEIHGKENIFISDNFKDILLFISNFIKSNRSIIYNDLSFVPQKFLDDPLKLRLSKNRGFLGLNINLNCAGTRQRKFPFLVI